MPLVAGSVSVDPVTGVVTGSGFARDVYDDLEAATNFQGMILPGLAVAREQLAVIANASAVLIDHVTANATVATVDDGTGGAVSWAGSGTGTVA